MRDPRMRADQIRDAVVKLTKTLARDSIRVTQIGVSAYCSFNKVTGKVETINIPIIPDNPTVEFLNAIQGYLDHEVGHALFTDGNVGMSPKVATAGVSRAVHGNMTNIVEDVRIEAAMANLYLGSGANLSSTLEWVIDKVFKPDIVELGPIDPTNEAQVKQIRQRAMVPYLRARGGQHICQSFLTDMGLDAAFVEIDRRLPTLAADLAALTSTQDAQDLALKIVLAINPPTPPEPPKPAPPPPEEKEETPPEPEEEKAEEAEAPEEDEPEEEKAEAEEDEDEEDEPEEEKPEPEDEEDEGEPEDSDDEPGEGESDAEPDEEDEGDGEGEGSDDDEEGEGAVGAESDEGEPSDDESEGEGEGSESEGEGDPSDGDPSDGESDGEGESEGDEADGEAPSASAGGTLDLDLDSLKELGDTLAGLMGEDLKGAFSDKVQTDLTRENDRIEPYEVKDDVDCRPLEAIVAKIAGPMQKDLQRIMTARGQAYNVPGKRSGKLNSPALHRLSTGDDRVFKSRIMAETNKVAVSLLVDLSGSMNGTSKGYTSKISTALISAWAFSEVLDRLKIPNEVLGFTTGTMKMSHKVFNDAVNDMVAKTSLDHGTIRTCPIWMPIFKSFDEKFGPVVKRRLTHMEKHRTRMSGNDDATALLYASERLRKRPETRKILLVFSDGQPAESGVDQRVLWNSVKENVKAIVKQGMEVVGIGIMSTAVTGFYPRNVTINSAAELPKVTMTQLRQLLTA